MTGCCERMVEQRHCEELPTPRHGRWPALLARPLTVILAVAAPGLIAAAPLSVTSAGTATYSRVIAVPPGAAGLAPQISLSYAGGSGNGPLGYGWSLQGLSAITRCAAIPAIDAKWSRITYGPSDKLCLDGVRLIQTDESGSATATSNAVGVAVATQVNDAQGLGSTAYREFRTEKDIYARVRAYGYANNDTTGASGPAYLKVWMKSGQIFEYGASPSADANANALIARSTSSSPMVWALARVSDTAGNRIDFKYDQRLVNWGTGPTAGASTAGREWVIREIQYSGNKVIFSYDGDTRTDRSEAYHEGSKTVSVRRLASITTYVNSANTSAFGPATSAVAVKTVKLQYDKGPVTGRSLLASIRECAGDASSTRCLPAESFTYTPGGGDVYTINDAFRNDALALAQTVLRNSTRTLNTIAFDIDGDGKTDLLRWGDQPADNRVWFSNGDGTFRQATNFNIGVNLGASNGCYTTFVADVDGDGLPDLIRYRASAMNSGTACPTTDTAQLVFINNGNGSFTQKSLTGVALSLSKALPLGNGITSSGSTFYVIDVNGDGKADIITAVTGALSAASTDVCTGCTKVYLGDGTGNFSPVTSNLKDINVYNSDYQAVPIVADLNGDGLQDLLVWKVVGSYAQTRIWLSKGDGSFDGGAAYASNQSPSSPMVTPYKTVIDVNGDGKPEFIVSTVLELAADSQAFKQTYSPSLPPGAVLDLNGDGLPDLLTTSDTASQNALLLSNGDGTFRKSTTFNLGGASAVQLSKSNSSFDYIVGDFTGRGSVEFLRTASIPAIGDSASNLLLVKSEATPPDLLKSVRTSSGATTTLYYVPLGNPSTGSPSANLGSRYTSDRGNSTYAVANATELTPSVYVVATSVSDAGVGTASVNTEYAYTGFKVSRTGRGSLGFRLVDVQTVAPNGEPLDSKTVYLQFHPYIGAVKSAVTLRGVIGASSTPAAPPMVIQNAYCDRSNAAAAGDVECPVTAKIARPYLYKSKNVVYETDNTLARIVTLTSQYNDTGDVVRVDSTTTGKVAGLDQTFTRSTVNSYDTPDTSCSDISTCAWVMGRLNRTTTSSSVPNSLDSIPKSAGSGANASATRGNVP